jgi:hypothetical protein
MGRYCSLLKTFEFIFFLLWKVLKKKMKWVNSEYLGHNVIGPHLSLVEILCWRTHSEVRRTQFFLFCLITVALFVMHSVVGFLGSVREVRRYCLTSVIGRCNTILPFLVDLSHSASCAPWVTTTVGTRGNLPTKKINPFSLLWQFLSVLLSIRWGLKVIFNSLGRFGSLLLVSRMVGLATGQACSAAFPIS